MNRTDYKSFIEALAPTVELEIDQVGGYWPVEVAASVAGEELGNAAQNIRADNATSYCDFMTNAFWVLICVSNQYCCDLAQASSKDWDILSEKGANTTPKDALLSTYSYYGELLRIVNRYEHGIYTDDDSTTSISKVIVCAHHEIIAGITSAGGNIEELVKKRIELVRSFKGRPDMPQNPRFDPTMGHTISRFRELSSSTMCPFAKSAKVWTTYPWRKNEDPADYLKSMDITLQRFARVCHPEAFDGLVIEVMGVASMDELKTKTKILLDHLGRLSQQNPMRKPIEKKEWRFSLLGIDVFLTIFSSIYDQSHPRYSGANGSTFFFFQPQTSFKAKAAKEKETIRNKFKENDQDYTPLLKKVKFEAHKYIKPENLDTDEPIVWWK